MADFLAGVLRRLSRCGGVACMVVLPALARGAGGAVGDPPAPEALERTAARCVARLGLFDLRFVGTPGQRDFWIAERVLAVAHAAAPADEIILRQLIECAENAGDGGAVVELTRELIRLDPADSVAQLRLISASMRGYQNADDRLGAYDRWLGSEGESVDPAVRSRLALDAALLAREKGDAAGFAARLGRALELDSTNKDAATLALAFYQQRVSDPVGEFELMLAVLNADPLDVELHRAIAALLLRNGSFKGAERFYNVVSTLLAQSQEQAGEEEASTRDVIRWMTHGARAVVEKYNREIGEFRQSTRRQIEDAEKDKRAPSIIATMTRPEQVRLRLASEWVRLFASVALADEQVIDASYEEFIGTALADSGRLSKPDERPKGMSEEEATAQVRGLLTETAFARLLANKDAAKVDESLDILRADPAVDRDRLTMLEGWRLLRKGDGAGAARLLGPLAASDPLAALGAAMALEAGGDRAGAAAAFEALARRETGALPGAMAATHFERLSGQPIPETAVAARLSSLAAGVPSWLEELLSNPRRIQTIDAVLENDTVRALDPARIRLTMRNTAPIPLGVGAERPIDARFLIAPNVQIGTESLPTGDKLQVVSMERRLRLLPQEQFSAVVPADVAQLSMFFEQVSGRRCRVRYRVLQGFMATSQASYDAGPHSLTAECGPLTREVLGKSLADVPGLVRAAEQGSARDVTEAILVVRGRGLPLLGMTPLSKDELASFYAAVAKHLPEVPVAAQLLILSELGTGAQSPEVGVVDEAARKLADPAVRTLFITMRAGRADDPVFSDPAVVSDPVLGPLAEQVRQRLESGVNTYSNFVGINVSQPATTAPAGGGGSAAQPEAK